MGRKKKQQTLGKTELITRSDRALARRLHKDEHIIEDKELPDHNGDYYYYMACWLYGSLIDELEVIKKLIKSR